jgi:UDP-glucose 4-epimerase
VLVTGGAGFIGSHLVDGLLYRGHEVTVIDNLSQGSIDNLARAKRNPRFRFVRGDVTNEKECMSAAAGCDTVFHLAANPEARLTDAKVHFEQNLYATDCVLEAAAAREAMDFVFTSTSTVYGEARQVPTREDFAPMVPISMYGTCKLASEALVAGYCGSRGMRGTVFRLANVVGGRAGHGVVVDFVRKLRSDPRKLEILGDGTQTKSYVLVDDCVEGIVRALEAKRGSYETYNLGSEDAIDVDTVARVVVEEMGLKEVKFVHTGGVEGGRGWVGDVKRMWLDISRLRALGWATSRSSSESIREAARAILGETGK